MSKTPTEIVDEMMERIQRGGWIQGSFGGENRGHCLMGAMNEACADTPFAVRDEVTTALTRAIRDREGIVRKIWKWNDERGRSIEDVLLVLKDARVALEESQ